MFMKQYIHRLPADYDMDHVVKRATGLGPDWDLTPGLGFKAFIAQRRGEHGAVGNSYSSLYLWLNESSAVDFITGDRFRKVVEGFGRPAIETWLPLAAGYGEIESARTVYREDIDIAPGTDMAALKAEERGRTRRAVDFSGTVAAISAIDLATWRLSRFTLSSQALVMPARGSGYEILYLASPGAELLRGAASRAA